VFLLGVGGFVGEAVLLCLVLCVVACSAGGYEVGAGVCSSLGYGEDVVYLVGGLSAVLAGVFVSVEYGGSSGFPAFGCYPGGAFPFFYFVCGAVVAADDYFGAADFAAYSGGFSHVVRR
jgi:hypothetical protein